MNHINWSMNTLDWKSQNDIYNNNKIYRESQNQRDCNDQDDFEFILLKDFYYPLIRQQIDEKFQMEGGNRKVKSKCVSDLDNLDKQHENLMIAKKFLWDEIDRGIQLLGKDCEEYNYDGILIYFIKNFCYLIQKHYDDYLLIDELFYYDIKTWRDISHAWIDLKYDIIRKYGRFNPITFSEYAENLYYWKFIYYFRDNKLGHIGTKLWMINLICLFSQDSERLFEEIKELDIRNTNEFLSWIELNQDLIDKQTLREQDNLQKNMLHLCDFKLYPKSPSVFDAKVEVITQLLNKDPDLKKKYIVANATGCFAIMTCGGKKYFTISGMDDKDDRDKLNSLGSDIMPPEYKRVMLDWKTRYYYSSTQYILYEKYKDNEAKHKEQENCNWQKRMFSCCEKKLISKLFEDRYKKKYTMYVKLKPCLMCERAIQAYDKELCEESHICYPKNARKSNLYNLSKYDIVAKEIVNMNARE